MGHRGLNFKHAVFCWDFWAFSVDCDSGGGGDDDDDDDGDIR